MPLSPTKRFVNWTATGFTPTGGTLQPYTGVRSVAFDPGGNLIKFSGDGDRYPTTIVNDMNEPSCTIQAADLASVRMSPPGTVGTVTATHNDARNGAQAGGGGIAYTLANAVVRNTPISGEHRQFGSGTVQFDAFSSDGLTNPLSATAL